MAARRILRLAGDGDSLPDAVEAVAGRFLEGLSCPPTDLAGLCTTLNVLECEAADIPVNGELHRLGKTYRIRYSRQLTPARQRFTVAHELGHVILASTGPRCPQSGEEVERLCDMLATALLLPRERFAEAIGTDHSPSAILAAARSFEVSTTPAALRYAALFKASVFEVEAGRVSWGHGAIRRGLVSSDIRPAVERAMRGGAGEEDVTIGDRASRFRLQWTPSGRGRALFLATPIRSGGR